MHSRLKAFLVTLYHTRHPSSHLDRGSPLSRLGLSHCSKVCFHFKMFPRLNWTPVWQASTLSSLSPRIPLSLRILLYHCSFCFGQRTSFSTTPKWSHSPRLISLPENGKLTKKKNDSIASRNLKGPERGGRSSSTYYEIICCCDNCNRVFVTFLLM